MTDDHPLPVSSLALLSKPDDRFAPLLFQMDRIELEIIEGQTFVERTIYMDGRSFYRCKFVSCSLFVELGQFKANECVFDHCAINWRGRASTTVKFHLMGSGQPEPRPT
jgi:hypothetical protein